MSLAPVRSVMVVACLAFAGCTSPATEVAQTTVDQTVPTPTRLPSSSAVPTTSVPPQPEVWPAGMVASCDEAGDDCELPWLEAWAIDRERVVDRIVENGWGLGDDDVLRGPGGLSIDFGDCPGGWDRTAGLADDEVRLALVSPESGDLGIPGPSGGIPSYVDAVNAEGGVGGRQIRLEVFDDQYLPSETARHIDQLVDDGEWFAITTIGSPSLNESAASLEAACVPHPLVLAGGTQGIAGVRPFTTGWQMAYATEVELAIRYVVDSWSWPMPPKIGALVMDNEFGRGVLEATEVSLELLLPDAQFVTVLHDPAAPVLTTEVAALLDSEPDVFLALTAGNPCLLAMQEVGAGAVQPELRFLLSPCHRSNEFLVPAGQAADGWLGFSSGPEHLDQLPPDSESSGQWIEAQFRQAGVDPLWGATVEGWHWAWHYVELLRIAESLPGGLTRPNFLLATWAADLRPPLNWPAVRFTLNGPADPHPIETARLMRYTSADEAWHELLTVSNE